MKRIPILLASASILLSSNAASAQESNTKKEYSISTYGWVRTEYIFDTRQSAKVREFNLNLYPLDKKIDANGKDINATGASNFLSITSRVGVKFSGPDVWGAKVSGNIEGDFFGNTEIGATSGTGTIGLFRLRHAIANLAWAKTSLTFGQTWYPSYITEVFPGVVNFNTGILFNPFGWAGQVKVAQKLTPELTLIAVAYKDREFTTATATGASTNSATFNSSIPSLHGQLQYKSKSIVAGIAAEYQSLKPAIEAAALADDHKVNSTNILAYFKYSNSKIIAKAYGISGGNLYHGVMLGGFAGYMQSNGQESYKATKTTAAWVDIASANSSVAPGLFLGYTKNSGVASGYSNLYMRGFAGTRVLDNVWRASARVDFKQNKFKISPEIEYTAAKWADMKADATAGANANQVGNFRVMATVMYNF